MLNGGSMVWGFCVYFVYMIPLETDVLRKHRFQKVTFTWSINWDVNNNIGRVNGISFYLQGFQKKLDTEKMEHRIGSDRDSDRWKDSRETDGQEREEDELWISILVRKVLIYQDLS